mgnify:CR=1 FL=1
MCSWPRRAKQLPKTITLIKLLFFTSNVNSKRVGVIILVISIALLVIFLISSRSLEEQGKQLGCFSDKDCQPIQRSITVINLGFGFFGFILALGFYLIFFSRGEEALLNKINKEEQKINAEQKVSLMMMGLDNFEKEVIQEIRKQDGVTQNTLKLRVNMSKAKLSQVLASLEKKGFIKRQPEKKTLAIYLAVHFE